MGTTTRAIGFGFSVLLIGCHALGPNTALDERSVLPLRSMRLYENGVGYFEREGRLSARGDATLGVPASHVDDALKTLLVLSSGDAKVSGIEFPSVVSDSAARSLAGLTSESDTPIDYAHVLGSLKGFRVALETRNGAIVRGRLLDVESVDDPKKTEKMPPASLDALKAFSLLVVAENGDLIRVRTSDLEKIHPLDPEFSARLQTAADALGGRAAQLGRELRVLASSNAPIRIGYIAEAPVWRSSYRLLLAPDGVHGELQGWALVHNDTDEAWQRIHVELVNGAPDSFLFPLAAPRYARRALETPETELSTVPQLATRTADGLWGDHTDTEEAFGSGGLGLSGVGESGGGTGEGIGLGDIGTIGHGNGTGGASPSAEVSIGDLAATPEAKPRDEGRLFSYVLSEPVSLRAHGSALLPLLRSPIAARRLTRFDRGQPGRATVRFQNDSPYILPAGPVAIFERAGFSGEALLHRMVPSGRVFLEYGADLDAVLHETHRDVSRATAKVTWNEHSRELDEHFVQVSERTLTVENHGQSPRTAAYVLSGVVRNAQVDGADELDFDDELNQALAFIDVPGEKVVERRLQIKEARVVTTALEQLDAETVSRLATTDALTAAERATLSAALPHIAELERATRHVTELEQSEKEVEADLSRNRGYLEAGHGAESNANPIAVRMVELEKNLEGLRRDVALAQIGAKGLEKVAARALDPLAVTAAR